MESEINLNSSNRKYVQRLALFISGADTSPQTYLFLPLGIITLGYFFSLPGCLYWIFRDWYEQNYSQNAVADDKLDNVNFSKV